MGRVLTVLLLSLSLTAFAQTTTPTKATDSIPAKVNLDPGPAVVPGSSTPINIVVPTSVPGQAPAVTEQYQLATPIMPSGPPADAVSARPRTTTAPATATGDEAAVPVANVSFASPGSITEPASTVSVADAAAQYKTKKGSLNSRQFDNSSLTNLSDVNPSNLRNAGQVNLPQSDMSAADETYGSSKPEHAAAGDVLDPRDLAAVEAAMARSDQAPADAATEATPNEATPNTEVAANEELAATRYDQMVAEAEQSSTTEPTQDAAAQSTEEQAVAQRREQLSETGGMLPLVALLGVLALSGGGVALARARA